jgi:hypothetical protein
MASQARKNRHCAEPIPSGTEPSLAGLPEELLLNVLQHADVTSVSRLRQTRKSFVPACTTAIRDKVKLMKVLYVHPCPTSVQRAISICQLDVSSEVKEICFVGKNFRNDEEDKLFHAGSAIFVPAGPAAFPWPVREPLEDDASQTNPWAQALTQLQENVVCKFQSSYRELLSSLAALRITRFSFSESCDEPGFNMISAQRIASWRETVESENKLIPQTEFKFTDIDAVAAVLSDPRFTFTRLKITHELPYEGCAPSLGMMLIGSYRALTHVDLTVSHGCHSAWGCHYSDFLSSTCSTLVELKIGFQYRDTTPVVPIGDEEVDFACIVQMLELPRLQHLELRRFPAPDANLPADNPNAVMLQHVDLGHFLAQRCKKLRFLQLTNVVPVLSGQSPPKPWTMADVVLQDFGSVASEISGLDEGTRAWDIDFSA